MADMPQNLNKPNPMYLIYVYKEDLVLNNLQWYYLPTPPLGQDMTQCQFLSGV